MSGDNQKLKMLYLCQIFTEFTDDEHDLTMKEILAHLRTYGITADRKAIYRDLDELSRFGLDIIQERRGRNTYYHLGNRKFELPELKLLVDSVQAAKFIPDEKSKVLIEKIESMASTYEARQLQRQVVIAGRVKTNNNQIYYNVDRIYTAIDQDCQITFHYFQWDVNKKRILRHGGALYQVSPWCMMWFDEYYYLVAYDAEDEKIKHYRVDKMLDLTISGAAREGARKFQEFDMAKYSNCLFGMYGGDTVRVTLEGTSDMAAVLIDRLGTDIALFPKDHEHFTAHVDVIPSGQFLGWIFALGENVRITAPDSIVRAMRDETARLTRQYGI